MVEGVHKFSVRDKEVLQELQALSSKTRVRLGYVAWIIMPYRFGDTNSEIVRVEKLPH